MKDIYGNLIGTETETNAETEVTIMALYQNHDDWTSPISSADLENWQQIYGTNIAGIATS